VSVRRVRGRSRHNWKDCIWRPSVLCILPVLRMQGPLLGQWEGGMRGADWGFLSLLRLSLYRCHSKNGKEKVKHVRDGCGRRPVLYPS
jgi:hypothetical protein